MTSVVQLLRGEAARAHDSAERSFAISQEQRFSLYVILSRISRGRAIGDLGRVAEGLTDIARGLDEARRSGVGYMRPMMEGWLADMHAGAGDHETALSIIERALADLGDLTGRAWESELHRKKAQFVLALNPTRVGAAESHLTQAIDVARGQRAKSLELRAAIDLAERWRTQGRADDARALLDPICSWFDEGADTLDLRRAREVLSALH
jgi:predicted ATPase